MRLIRKKKAAESIITYDNSGKSLVNQQAYYETYLTKVSDISAQVMNFLELWDPKNETNRYDAVSLVNADKTKLLEFGNTSLMFNGVLQQYVLRLQEMEKQAIELINTLKKEYRIK